MEPLADGGAHLAGLWPRVTGSQTLTISRDYEGRRRYDFPATATLDSVAEAARKAYTSAGRALVALGKTAPDVAEVLKPVVEPLGAALTETARSDSWGEAVAAQLRAVRAAAQAASVEISGGLDTALTEIEGVAATVAGDTTQGNEARGWIDQQLPTFVYLDEWDTVEGHYLISEFLERSRHGGMTANDRLFAKLLKVAELDAAQLQGLLNSTHEERRLLTDRASRTVTRTLRSLWTDRQVTVEFAVDADHFDVLVKDADTDALVPLDERSRGFKWYFSFFITFAADTQGGDKENAILLLDEPGLFLHATAQENLLRFLDTLPNQIVYTTHSPFMIDAERLDDVRTVNLVEGAGTTVTGDPTGDANTLFPLQAALGYNLTQTLFVGSKNIVVEGVTDFWYLSTASGHLYAQGRTGLDGEIVLTPAGGAQKTPFMVALLTSQQLRVVVLFDSEPMTEETAKHLLQERLIRDDGILFVGQVFDPPRKGADLEDLLDEAVFVRLVEESYANELSGRPLALNPKIPRVITRVEHAFEGLGVEFFKTRPASLWTRKMATDPASVWSEATAERFERLFQRMNAAVAKMETSKRKPFA